MLVSYLVCLFYAKTIYSTDFHKIRQTVVTGPLKNSLDFGGNPDNVYVRARVGVGLRSQLAGAPSFCARDDVCICYTAIVSWKQFCDISCGLGGGMRSTECRSSFFFLHTDDGRN